MADNYSPEEIQRIQAEYAYHLQNNIPISKELAMEFANAKVGIKNWNQELNKTVKQLGSGVLNTLAALKDGAQGSSVFNKNITDSADALENFLKRFGFLGTMLGKILTAGARYATEANKQSDALYKSYEDLSRFGQATASGMDDVFSTMQKFSYGIGELDQMTALLRDNAKSLALFGGTVAQGTERIANTANDFKESGLQEYFRKMGVNVDNQNRAIAGYAKQTANLGQAQGKTQADITKGAAEYLREFEALTRLTGQTREEMEQQREQAMAVDQFAATVSEMGDQGKELQATFNLLMKIDPAKARAFAESVSGFMTGSKEQNQLFQSSGGKLFGVVDSLKKGTMRAGEAVDNLFPKGKALEFQRNLAKMGTGAEFAGNFGGMLKANNQSMKEAQETAEGQIDVNSDLTDAAVDLRQSQMKARDAFQAMINDGVTPATKAMAALAKVTEIAAEGSKGFWDKALDKLGNPFGMGAAPGGKSGGGAVAGGAGGTAIVNPGKSVQIGDEVRSGGDRNWRSNNPGNIEYGKFAISMGAIGSDGRFAIFSTEEMGRKAADTLLKGKAYADLSAAAAIKKWAPPSENDSASYIKNVSKMANLDMTKKYVDMSKEEQGRFLDAMKKIEGGRSGKITKAGESTTTAATPSSAKPSATPATTSTATAPTTTAPTTTAPATAPATTAPTATAPATAPVTLPSATANTRDADAMAKMNAQWQKQYPTVPISGATGFNGMLTGPASGYKPDITMHGTENLKITPTDKANQTAIPGMDTTIMSQQLSKMDQLVQAFNNTSTQDMMAMQLNKLDELVRVMQNQVNVSTKILQQSR